MYFLHVSPLRGQTYLTPVFSSACRRAFPLARFHVQQSFSDCNLVPRVLSLPPSRRYPGFGWSRVSLKQTAPHQGGLAFLQEAKGKGKKKRMAIFSNWHEDRGMEVISSLFFKDRDAEKIYSLLSAAFQKHK